VRDLLGGRPKRIAASRAPRSDRFTTLLDWGNCTVVYEYPIDDMARFDAGLDLHARRSRMHLLNHIHHIRNLPMRLELQDSTADGNAWSILRSDCKDPIEAELDGLRAAIVHSVENRTPASASLVDIDILEAMVAHLRPGRVAS
jgi:myo-inositol 2-dehydrogenase/D-chiro-inositol 1-dehydrogenase